MASNAHISADKLEAGETLSGNYFYDDQDGDAEGGSAFKWYRVDNDGVSNQTLIEGANDKSYTLTAEDSGRKIIFEVTPIDNKGVQGLPLTAITDNDVSDPAPVLTGLSAKTPEEQSYFNSAHTPGSDDKDIATAQLWRSTPDGLDYQSQVYDELSTDYEWGSTISLDGNYKLVVTDQGGNATTVYFTIDQIVPEVTDVVQSQIHGLENGVYDYGDLIMIKFSDYIKKFDFYDEMSGTDNAGEAAGLTMPVLEAAAQRSGYSFGEGAQLTAASYIPFQPLYGNDFEISLGDNANLPTEGLMLELDAANIFTVSKIQAAGDTVTVAIPALESSNHAPILNETWTAPEFTAGEAGNLNLTGLFMDEDEDELTYSTENLTPDIAVITEDAGAVLTLNPVAAGTAKFKVTVSDGTTSEVTTISITVKNVQPTPYISEMVWGSDEVTQAIELYNPTDTPVTGVRLTIGGQEIYVDESFTIPAHGVHVIADWLGNFNFEDQEMYYAAMDMEFDPEGTEPLEVILYVNDVPVDTTSMSPQETMRRKTTVIKGTSSYKQSEWEFYPVDTTDGLGSHQ